MAIDDTDDKLKLIHQPKEIKRQQNKNGNRNGLRIGYRKPEKPIDYLIERFSEYMFFSDPAAIYALMGGMAGNLLKGPPVWIMLIGASSSGKTLILDTLKRIPRVEASDNFNDAAMFLSGTASKDRSKKATGGLLRAIEPHGALVLKDFTDVLSMPPDKVKAILGIFRHIYDGSWDRPLGVEGGRTLHWQGKAAMFGGVTGKIDEVHATSSVLGERWLYLRMEEGHGFAMLQKMLGNNGEASGEKLRCLVRAFFEGMDLEFGQEEVPREIEAREVLRIGRIAKFAASCRSGVTWNNYSKEILSIGDTEMEPRIGGALAQLYLGMERIGVREKERWRVLRKIAMDSMPKIRKVIMECVIRGGEKGTTMGEIMEAYTVKEARGASRAVVDRSVVELAAHKVVRKERESGDGEEDGEVGGVSKVRVKMTEEMRREYKAGFES